MWLREFSLTDWESCQTPALFMSPIVLRRSGRCFGTRHLRKEPPRHQINPPCHQAFKVMARLPKSNRSINVIIKDMRNEPHKSSTKYFLLQNMFSTSWIVGFQLGQEPSVKFHSGDFCESPLSLNSMENPEHTMILPRTQSMHRWIFPKFWMIN